MADKKKMKKKCCGKFRKKGKHCSSCPLTGTPEKCKGDKDYCRDCDSPAKSKKGKKTKKKVADRKKKKK